MCCATREIQPFRPNCPECRNEPQHRLFRHPGLSPRSRANKKPNDEPLIETPSAAYPEAAYADVERFDHISSIEFLAPSRKSSSARAPAETVRRVR
jgi:hypothetical protein